MGLMVFPYCKKPDNNTLITEEKDVIVIGAGIAGLATAKSLKSKGYNVRILEASMRYGGRIKTIDIDGYKADFGASWIHGINGNPLYSLANENSIQTKTTHYNPSYIFDMDGEDITSEEWEEVEGLLGQLVDLAYENPNVSLSELLTLMEPNLNLTEKMKRIFYGGVRSEIEIPYAVDAPEISSKALTTNDSFLGNDVIFPNGMAELTDILAEGLNIIYNTFVTKISYTGDKISIYAKNPSHIDPKRSCMACHSSSNASVLEHEEIFSADKVVFTLPLGMLKNENVVFEPALPAHKLVAINNLGIGTMNKVFLIFDQNFWYKDGYFFQYLKENYSNEIEFFSPAPTGTENILVAVFAGKQARSIEHMGDADLLNLIMDDLKKMFGESIPQPISWQKTTWHSNTFSLGAYPHLKPGSDLSACSIIAEPIGEKLFFAGDATSKDYMATAHGAYLSGLEAAYRLGG